MKTIANANNKGGVGKTTTSHNLARLISKDFDYKVLVIDMDQQMNLTDILYDSKNTPPHGTIVDVFRSNPKPEDVIVKTKYENVFLIPAHSELVNVENEIANKKNSTKFLRHWLAANDDVISNIYGIDVVIIDCAPDVGKIENNAFEAADTIIVVLIPSDQAVQGLTPFASKFAHPERENEIVILFNEYDSENEICLEVEKSISSSNFPFKKHLIRAFIPRHKAIEKSNYKKCISIAEYDAKYFSEDKINPYKQYELFAKELIERGII